MLDLEDFNLRSTDERFKEVNFNGKLFDSFEANNFNVNLYMYSDFLVEVLLRLEIGTIVEINGITIDQAADKYISLQDILE